MKKIKFIDILIYILLGLIISPIIYIFFNSFKENSELTKHIFENLLSEYILNTFIILIPTLILTLIMGVSFAYFETFYDFKFRSIFKYIIILSFAIPNYVLGYIYVDFFTGPLYMFLSKYNINLYIDIANIYTLSIILSLSFYPYVYIVSRSYMKKISLDLIHSSLLLGKNTFTTFLKVIIPISKPAIISALSLVLMETLNAFALPYFFGIPVFSTGIYDSWINYYDLDGAIKLSSIIMTFILIFLVLENLSRKNKKYIMKVGTIKRIKLNKKDETILISIFFIVFLLSFFIPIIYLLRWAILSYSYIDFSYLLELTINTLNILIPSVLFIIFISILIISRLRFKNKKYNWIISRLISIGYSIPGSVIAIGFLSIFLFFDNFFIEKGIFDNLILIKSPFLIVVAYTTRFIYLSYFNLENSINSSGNIFHYASRLLGYSSLKTFFKVDIFLLKNAIISSAILISVEILKEMSLSSLLANANTLASQMKNYASDEELSLIAFPALILISISLFLLVIYNKIESEKK